VPIDADVIVIGGGTSGAAAALSLARAGRRVIVLDRFKPPHEHGEHHGGQRLFRTAYFEHPGYVPLLRRALDGWRRLEAESGERLLELTGAVYVGAPGGELISGSLRSAAAHGVPHEVLSPHEATEALPGAVLHESCVVMRERTAGYVRCDAAIAALLRVAEATGAKIRSGVPASGWSASSNSVEVATAGGILRAGLLIIAAGPWSGALLSDIGVRLTVTRQVQAYVEASPGGGPACCWAVEGLDGLFVYGFPRDHHAGTIKFGVHVHGPVLDPDRPTPSVTAREIEQARSALRGVFPSLANGRIHGSACRYTNSPDTHFIIDRHPAFPNVVFGAGFSGHGFKFAPVLGELLAKLVMDPGAEHPAPFLALSRFGGGG